MSSLLRPFSRSINPSSLRSRLPVQRAFLKPTILHRAVASSVSNKPASQTFEQVGVNIKEEAGNAASDVAKVIAGANSLTDDSVVPPKTSFLGITSSVAGQVPKPVMVFGLAGAIPYLGAGGTTVYYAHQAGQAASGVATSVDPGVALTILDQALNLQVTYGAVMLSFLGALHWGMEFAGYGGQKGYSRLMLGAAPVLFAWPTLALQPMTALLVQWVGFTGLWWADSKVTTMGWTPKWYSQYRFYLSILVGTCIIGSLAGTSYYGPVAGHGFLTHDLQAIREERKELMATNAKVPGPVSATPAEDEDDAFVRLKKKVPKEDKEDKATEKNIE